MYGHMRAMDAPIAKQRQRNCDPDPMGLILIQQKTKNKNIHLTPVMLFVVGDSATHAFCLVEPKWLCLWRALLSIIAVKARKK